MPCPMVWVAGMASQIGTIVGFFDRFPVVGNEKQERIR